MTAVITGMGIVSALGVGVQPSWDALLAGEVGVGPISSFDAATLATRVAGEVPGAWEGPDRKSAFGVAAARQAWHAARCGADERDAWLCVGLGLEEANLAGFAPLFEDGRIAWVRAQDERLRTPVDRCATEQRAALGLRGPAVVNASACAAGALAVAQAAAWVQRGTATVVLCGAADSMINPLGIGGMTRLGAPSPRNAPDACRPFDARRDGLAVGEGAAMFVVEHAERAAARGATALAEIAGWGSTQDAYRATAPRPDGSAAAGAMTSALRRAGIDPAAIGYVNAHGTGTPAGDPAEVQAIRRAFGDAAAGVAVSSTKGATGHLMAAAGALELAVCVAALRAGVAPATANLSLPDPACDLDLIRDAPRPIDTAHVMSNSFGFGGQNASLILRRPR